MLEGAPILPGARMRAAISTSIKKKALVEIILLLFDFTGLQSIYHVELPSRLPRIPRGGVLCLATPISLSGARSCSLVINVGVGA